MDLLKSFIKNEPLRAALYPLLAVLVVMLVKDPSLANVITGALALLLGVGGTEVARSKVTPVSKLP